MQQRVLPPVLLFDLDDTILRFNAGQPNFWQLACAEYLPEGWQASGVLESIAKHSDWFWGEDARAFWGRQNMPLARREVARRALGPAGLLAFADAVADEMDSRKEAAVCPFDGALETLEQLRRAGHRLALLTNGSSLYQRRKIDRFALEQHFELILVEGELGYGKPDTRVFRQALDQLKARPSEAWMVGDNLDADIAGAKSVGVFGVWHDAVGAGRAPSDRVVPDLTIASISELLTLNRPQ